VQQGVVDEQRAAIGLRLDDVLRRYRAAAGGLVDDDDGRAEFVLSSRASRSVDPPGDAGT
jgi:hypothetical protein